MGKNDVEIKVVLTGNAAKQYTRSMGVIRSQNSKTSASMKTMGKTASKSFDAAKRSAMGLKIAITAVGAYAVGRLGQAFIKAGSEVEDLTTEFKVLLGTVENAKKRMEELEAFAQTTPFQLAEVAKASKILETFTKGALSTGDALRMVGDAAAITAEKDFANLAMWVGRAYDGLQNNRPVGEAMMRLQELALVSGDARAKIEELTKAGKGKEAWKILEKSLMNAEGGMKELSKTATGLTSTIKDQLSAAMRQMMSTGAWDAFRKQLESITAGLTKALNDGTFTRLGEDLLQVAGTAKRFAVFLAEAGKSYAEFVLKVTDTEIAEAQAKSVNNLKDTEKLLGILQNLQGVLNEKTLTYAETMDKIKRTDALTKQVQELSGIKKSAEDLVSETLPRTQTRFRLLAQSILTDQEKLENEAVLRAERELALHEGNAEKIKEIRANLAIEMAKINKDFQKDPAGPVEGQSVDMLKIQESLQMERQLQLDHNIAMLELAGETRENEVELERLKFERIAEEGNKGLANTIRRKELEQAKLGAIEAKWDKIEEDRYKRNLKLRNTGIQMTTSMVLSSIAQMTSGYESLSKVTKAIAVAQGIQNTYGAAIAAYKSTAEIPMVGSVLAPIAAAAAVAAGLANVAKIVSAADGGVFSGPTSGYPAVLHGNEAVIPLKNGAVPVQIEGGAGGGTTIINNYYGAAGDSPEYMTDPERLQMLNESNREIEALGVS